MDLYCSLTITSEKGVTEETFNLVFPEYQQDVVRYECFAFKIEKTMLMKIFHQILRNHMAEDTECRQLSMTLKVNSSQKTHFCIKTPILETVSLHYIIRSELDKYRPAVLDNFDITLRDMFESMWDLIHNIATYMI
jgi:hypothetical protein